jgi:solute carrier family 26 (sodium-independent sulfate anion transporter), member 11
MAVLHLFGPVSLFYRYWRMSLADFIASMLSFWITLLVSAEYGIGVGVAWSVVWSLLRSAFASPNIEASAGDDERTRRSVFYNATTVAAYGEVSNLAVSDDTVVARFTDSIFFPNAHRGKSATVRAVQLVYDKMGGTAAAASARRNKDRSWSVTAERAVERARRERGVALRAVPLDVVILDCTAVSWIDVTGVLALGELKDDVRRHCGAAVQFRFVGLNAGVRQRFARAHWAFTEFDEPGRPGVDSLYPTLESAVGDNERPGSVLEAVVLDDEKKGGD